MFHELKNQQRLGEKVPEQELKEVDVIETSGSRKRWLFVVYLLTFYVPDFLIRWIGRMPRKDVRTAWREKYAINLLIWLSCALVVFLMSESRVSPFMHDY